MWDWVRKWRGSPRTAATIDALPSTPKSDVLPSLDHHAGAVSKRYAILHKYLQNRYATSVVLTFGQLEDLLGFALPASARTTPEWWTVTDVNADEPLSDAWTRAGRTASPNLPAQTVLFERTLIPRRG